MKKVIKMGILALVGITTACTSPTKPIAVGEIEDEYMNESSDAFNALSTEADTQKGFTAAANLIEVFKENSKEGSNNPDFVNNWSDFMGSLYEVMGVMTVDRIKYFSSSDQTYKDKYMGYYNDYLNLLAAYHDVLQGAYDASNYRNLLFGGMSEREVVALIASYATSDEETAYKVEFERIQNDAEEIYNQYYRSDEYVDKMYDLVVEYVETAKEYAEYKEIDYLADSYKSEYSRSYTPEQILPFYESVKKDLVPVIDAYKGEMISKDDLSEKDIEYIEAFDKYCFKNAKVDIIPLLEQYIDSVRPLKSAYKNLFSEKGLYCFSDNEASLGTAFTSFIRTANQPILFFSRNYQNTFTFVHEFGHYTSFYKTAGGNYPMDVSEIDSQANELLFASYMSDNEKMVPATKKGVEYLVEGKVYEQFSSIVNCTYVSEMEQIAFSYDLSDKEGFLKKIDEVSASYGGLANKKYWWAPFLTNPGYYISYATSSVGALEFYIKSRDNFDNAIADYTKLVEKNSYVETIDEVLELAHLHTIYKPEAVQYVANYFKK